ncbi:MAG: hypothetical protein HKN91_14410 [Acidimicrobiia bacterium]|nr:hypothetical protein [Acidimicrobiia bacterium]
MKGLAPVHAVEHLLRQLNDPATAALEDYITRGEIDSDQLDSARSRQSMLKNLSSLGVDFTDWEAGSEAFDEYFALAWEKTSRQAVTGADPLQAKFDGTTSDWDFTVQSLDELEEQESIPRNIKAAGALDYVYQLGERLGIFKMVDALVLRWANGLLDIPDGPGATRLYRYWKLKDDRYNEEERGLLYKRVLDRGNTKLLSGMVVNTDFALLWRNLMEDVATFIERSESNRPDDRGPSTVRIERDARQLQYNLTEHMTGMAQVQTQEIYAQLRDALEILSDPDVVSILAGGRRRNFWTVIERLSREEFGVSVNVEAMRAVAVDGNRVFEWLSEYVDGAADGPEFDDLLTAAESWIVAEASIAEDNLNGFDGSGDDEFEDDDEFDDFDDFDDDDF